MQVLWCTTQTPRNDCQGVVGALTTRRNLVVGVDSRRAGCSRVPLPTSLAALTGPGDVEPARQHTADVPLRRDGWLSPIELNERAEPLTTAMATPQTAAAATKRIGSGRPRRASDRGLLPITLESYLELLDWTGRQLRAGTHGVIPPALGSILDRLQVSAESWLETVARFGRRFQRALGLAAHLKVEAQRLGLTWLQGLRWSQVAFAPPLRS
jgi:hypothetical protein